MPLDGIKLDRLLDMLSSLDDRLSRMESGESRADAVNWDESAHPRGPDGKFTSGSGGGLANKAKAAYKATLGNGKPAVQGLAKHMIMSGEYSAKDIKAVIEEVSGEKGYNLNAVVKKLEAAGKSPPPMPAESKKEDDLNHFTEDELKLTPSEGEPQHESEKDEPPIPFPENANFTVINLAETYNLYGPEDYLATYSGHPFADPVTQDYHEKLMALAKATLDKNKSPVKVESHLSSLTQEDWDNFFKDHNLVKQGVGDLKMKEIKAALALPTLEEQQAALDQVSPISNAYISSHTDINSILEQAQHDLHEKTITSSSAPEKDPSNPFAPGSPAANATPPDQTSPKGDGIFGVDLPDQPTINQEALVNKLKGMSKEDAKDLLAGKLDTWENTFNIEYAKKLLAALEEPAVPKTTAAVPKAKLSPNTVAGYNISKPLWDGALEKNKPAIEVKDTELQKALSHDTLEAQVAAVDALTPIANPTGMAQKTFNDHIAKVKADYGVGETKPTPTANLPIGVSPKLENAVYHAAKAAPHRYIEKVTKHEGVGDAEFKAKLVADTKKIPGDHYAKVTAAYGNSTDAMTQAVDQAMDQYAKATLYTHTAEQLKAIEAYQNSAYGSINASLMKKNPGDVLKTNSNAARIQEALLNSFVPADTPVYRGISATLKDLTGFSDPQEAVGRAFEHKNFASVSRNIHTSKSFGDNTLLHFTVPAGTPGIVMNGQAGGEREILLGARSMFKVDKVEQQFVGSKLKHIVHCTYLGIRQDD